MLLDQGHLGTVATVVGLAEQVPPELLMISGESYAGLLSPWVRYERRLVPGKRGAVIALAPSPGSAMSTC